MTTIGYRIKLFRTLRLMSAQRLSDKMGGLLSRSVIANLESDRKTDVSVSELIALSDALNVSVDFLDPRLATRHEWDEDHADVFGQQVDRFERVDRGEEAPPRSWGNLGKELREAGITVPPGIFRLMNMAERSMVEALAERERDDPS